MGTPTLQRASPDTMDAARAAPFKRLLVPLDGSPLAERALPFARRLACTLKGDLILVRAAYVQGSQKDPVRAQLEAAAEAETYIARLADRFQANYSVETSVPFGDPASEIATVAEVRSADLIVMTTHGRSGLGRLLLGSVADSLLRQTELPMLLIRAGLPLRRWDEGIKRILVPLDGSALAEAALPTIAAFATAVGARLTLLRVVGTPRPDFTAYEIAYLPEDDETVTDQARLYLARVAAPLTQAGLDVQTEVLLGGAADQIVAATAEHQQDLIAMTTHARRGFDRLVVGSVADEVLRRTSVPLLLFRGSED